MNKPLIRTLMIACAATMALPAQGVMVARKKAQDPKPAADVPKANAESKVDGKVLHEKLMKALEQADLSDAERAKVMETLAKALHKAQGDAVEVHRAHAIDVVGEGHEGDAPVFVVRNVDGKTVTLMGSDAATVHPRVVVVGEKDGARVAKAVQGEARAVWVEDTAAPAAKGEKQFRINVVGQGAGEQCEVICEEICEEACEEGQEPKVKVLRRMIHGEPMNGGAAIDVSGPLVLKLEALEGKLDAERKAADGQRLKADDLRARAEKLRAAVIGVDPVQAEAQDVRVYVGDLLKSVDATKDVHLEVQRLHEAMAKAQEEGHRVHSIDGDGAMVFEWVGEAPKAKTKDKVKAKLKADKADADMADAIRELREEMRELRKMMKQIRKELRDEDEEEQLLAPAAAPSPVALPARVSMTMPAVPPVPPVAPVATTFGGFPAVATPAPAAAPNSTSAVGGSSALAPARAHGVGSSSTGPVELRRSNR